MHSDDFGALCDGVDIAQPSQLIREGLKVKVVSVVAKVIAEGLLEQHHVESRRSNSVQRRVGERPGIRGIEKAMSRGPCDGVQQRLAYRLVTVGCGECRDAISAGFEPITS